MAQLFYLPTDPVRDANGVLAPGAKLTFYLSGTSTLAAVYADAARTVPLPNPLTCDSSGRYPPIYMQDLTYRVVIADRNGSSLGAEIDPYVPGTAGGAGPPGINGGTSSNLTIGLFTGANGQSLAGSPEVVFTSGYRATGRGAASYVKDAAVDAAFVTAHPRWSFRSSQGVGYRLAESADGSIPFDAFGTYGDGTTDDLPAQLAYKDYCTAYKTIHGNSYYKSVPTLQLGRYVYYSSDSWNFDDGVYRIKGAGPHALDQGGNTAVVFASGKCGFIFQSWDTTGVTGTTTNTPKGSAYSHVSDVAVYSQGGTLGAAQHGFLVKSPATLERCFAYHFGGWGCLIAADVNYAGNANCFAVLRCGFMYNGSGGFGTIGGDANAGEISGIQANFNMGYGVSEQSFLDNHYRGGHTAGNGTATAGPNWAPYRTCAGAAAGGHLYRVNLGQEAGASTNAPSGTTASNTWWTYVGDGAASNIYRTWVTGLTWQAGGAALINGASNKASIIGLYMESDQMGGLNLSGRAMTINGGFAFWGGGAQLNAHDGRLWTPQIGTAQNNGDGIELTATQIQLSPSCFLERQTDAEVAYLRGTGGGTISMIRNGSTAARAYSVAFPAGISSGALFIGSGAAAPTTGTWARGDRINNDGSVTGLGTTDHWVCSVAGTPGTWLAKA